MIIKEGFTSNVLVGKLRQNLDEIKFYCFDGYFSNY